MIRFINHIGPWVLIAIGIGTLGTAVHRVNSNMQEITVQQAETSWTVLDDRGNEHTGLTHKQTRNHDSTHCTFQRPDGHQIEFYGNFIVFEE